MKTPTNDRYLVALLLVPAIFSGFIFELSVGHRHDYTGHFLAGYGSSIVAGGFLLRWRGTGATQDQGNSGQWLLLLVILCIGAGTIAELTIFRIAKFDEIDFCCQSLGAVLAGLVLPAFLKQHYQEWQFACCTSIGVVILGVGGVYAVA